MVIVLKPSSTNADVAALLGRLRDMDAAGYVGPGQPRTVEVLGAGPGFDRRKLEQMPAVDRVLDDLLRPEKKGYFDYWRQRLSSELGRLDGALAIELTADDLREIESAISKITVLGDRYPETLKQQTGR